MTEFEQNTIQNETAEQMPKAPNPKKPMPKGALIGIIAGAALVIALVILLVTGVIGGKDNKPADNNGGTSQSQTGGTQNQGGSSGNNENQGGTSQSQTGEAKDENYLTISFDSVGGSEVPSQKTKKGEKISKPSDPVRLGYTFIGWDYQGEIWSSDI